MSNFEDVVIRFFLAQESQSYLHKTTLVFHVQRLLN